MIDVEKMEPVLQKVYCILDDSDRHADETGLSDLLPVLLEHVNITSSLYLVTEDLCRSMPQIERIFSRIGAYLDAYRFARLYIHVVHPVALRRWEETEGCYDRLRHYVDVFNTEGYVHQEIPRLIVLPVIVWNGAEREPGGLAPLLEGLKRSFLPPSLYLDGTREYFSLNDELAGKTEKIYYGEPCEGDMSAVVLSLGYQDMVEETSSGVESGKSLEAPCPPTVIFSAKTGRVYPCMDAFSRGDFIMDVDGRFRIETLWAFYKGAGWGKREPARCRERAAVRLSRFHLPMAMRHEIGALLYHLGGLYQEKGAFNQAIEHLHGSLRLSPADKESGILFRIGLCQTMAGEYHRALEMFQAVEDAYRDRYFFHFYAGVCHFHNGDWEAALQRFLKAAVLEKAEDDKAQISLYIGTCHNNLGQYEAALGPLQEAARLAPSMREVWSTLGFSYFHLREYERAIDCLEKAVEIDPRSAMDYASLGANYRDRGDIPAAIAMFEKALAVDPGNNAAVQNLKRLRETGTALHRP
jgi:tetratricopeptide (TPR) repeat protein